MNVYVVTEGKTEAIVYRHWIPLVNEDLSAIDSLSELGMNNFYIVSAKGYPGYFDIIENAIDDVSSIGQFDRLVISADSEDMTRQEKFNELSECVSRKKCRAEIESLSSIFALKLGLLAIAKSSDPLLHRRDYANTAVFLM